MSLWDDIGSFLGSIGGDIGHALGGAQPQAPPQARPQFQAQQPQARPQILQPNPQIQQQQQQQQQQAQAADAQQQFQYNTTHPKFGPLVNNPRLQQQMLQQAKPQGFGVGGVLRALPGAAGNAVVQTGKGIITSGINTAELPGEAIATGIGAATGNKKLQQSAQQALLSKASNSWIAPLANTAIMAGGAAGANKILNNPKSTQAEKAGALKALNQYTAPAGFNTMDKPLPTTLKSASLIGQDIAQPLFMKGSQEALTRAAPAVQDAIAQSAEQARLNPELGAVGKNVDKTPSLPSEEPINPSVGGVVNGSAGKGQGSLLTSTGKKLTQAQFNKLIPTEKDVMSAEDKANLSPKEQMSLAELEGKGPQINNQLDDNAIAKMDAENPVKVSVLRNALDRLDPNDPNRFEHARAIIQTATAPIDAATRVAAYTARKSGLTVTQLADLVEHPEDHPNITPVQQQVVDDWKRLTNYGSATSHALGGKEPRINNFFKHAVDTSEWEQKGESPIFNTGTSKVANPNDFRGLDAIGRKTEGGKIVYPDLRSLHAKGIKLRNEDNLEKFILDYGRSLSTKTEKQALIYTFSKADANAVSHLHSLDMNNGKPLMLSDKGISEAKSYTQSPASKIGNIVDNAGSATKHVLLSTSQYHPANINYLTVVPHLLASGHPLRVLRVAGETPVAALAKTYSNNLVRKDLQNDTIAKSALIGSPMYRTDFTPTGVTPKMGQTVFGREVPIAHRQENMTAINQLEKHNVDLNSQAARERGTVANNASGFTNSKLHNVSPRVVRGWSRPFLAPQFEASKLNLVKTVFDPTTTMMARRSAFAAVAGKYGMETALAVGIGAALHQKFNNLADSAIQALFNPDIPTNQKDSKGNTIKYKLPDTGLSEILSIFAKPQRDKNGRLSITWNNLGDVISNIETDARNKLSPLAGIIAKIGTNTSYAGKPLSDPSADTGTRIQQATTSIITDLLPIGLQGIPYTKAVESHLPQASQQILNANKPGMNPLVKSLFSTIAATPETDTSTGKGLQTTQFYDAYNKATTGVNNKVADAIDLYMGSKKNPVTGQFDVKPNVNDTRSHASALLDQPQSIDRIIAMEKTLQSQGQKVDPLWLQPKANIVKVLQYQAMPPGGPDQVNWRNNNPWYDNGPNSLYNQRNNFYNSLPKGDLNQQQQPITYPTPTPAVAQKLTNYYNMYSSNPTQAENYLLANPDVQKQMDNQANYTNQLRVAQGYAALKTYPTPSPYVQAKLNSMTGMTSKEKAAVYADPQVAKWSQAEAVYELGKGFALAQLQGNGPSSQTLKSTISLGYDIVKNPDGTYALEYPQTQGTSGSTAPQAGATSSSGSSSSSSSGPASMKINVRLPVSRMKVPYPRHIKTTQARDYLKYGKILARVPQKGQAASNVPIAGIPLKAR